MTRMGFVVGATPSNVRAGGVGKKVRGREAQAAISPDNLETQRAAYAEAVADAVKIRLGNVGPDVDLPSPDVVAEFGLSAFKAGVSLLAEAVGPVYSTEGVTRLLEVKRQQVADRRTRGTIIAMRTSDDHWVYPAFQFTGRQINPQIRALLDVIRPSQPDWWTVAAWLNAPQDKWEGQSVVSRLRADPGGLEAVLPDVREAANRWAA